MGVDFFMKGALEPVVTNEGFQATCANLGAANTNGNFWFMVTDSDGDQTLIHIPHVLYIKKNHILED